MSTVITVENLGKKYNLRHQQRESYTALRDVISDGFKGVGKRFASLITRSPVSTPLSPSVEEFWALKDVSFEVKQGDRIGIIGRNGAGKSTLLKILSRITEPTTGSVRIKGRVASLLEVGTGFHPELTGRENIYLNGAILGMGRSEIRKKFDEIVDFAEIEKFLDTPVKRYSSGMYVRLAFAVAAHLEPEILVVDEVLAVGDAQFQKKCLGKMEDVSAREGRTVLFVSHNISSIQRLCNRGIVLDLGSVVMNSHVNEAVMRYLDYTNSDSLSYEIAQPEGYKRANITRIELVDHDLTRKNSVKTSDRIMVRFSYFIHHPIDSMQIAVCLLEEDGTQIFATSPQDANLEIPNVRGLFTSVVHFPDDLLMPHRYRIKVVIWEPVEGTIDMVDSISFLPHETESLCNNNPGGRLGIITMRCKWFAGEQSV
jgi:lipopolysaccharide transport system ATP-binding protein